MRYGVGVGRKVSAGTEARRSCGSRMVDMDAAGRDGRTRPERSASGPKACRAVRKIRSARGRCISQNGPTPFNASTGPPIELPLHRQVDVERLFLPAQSRCQRSLSPLPIEMPQPSVPAFRRSQLYHRPNAFRRWRRLDWQGAHVKDKANGGGRVRRTSGFRSRRRHSCAISLCLLTDSDIRMRPVVL